MREQYQRDRADKGDRLEVAQRVVGQALEYRQVECMRGGRAEDQGVAIRLAFGNIVATNDAGRARAILQHNLLAQYLAQLARDGTAEDIGLATGRKRDHQTNRPIRIPALRH